MTMYAAAPMPPTKASASPASASRETVRSTPLTIEGAGERDDHADQRDAW